MLQWGAWIDDEAFRVRTYSTDAFSIRREFRSEWPSGFCIIEFGLDHVTVETAFISQHYSIIWIA